MATVETAGQIAYRIGDKLYLNITNHCTLRCAFCPKQHGSYEVKGYDLTLDHLPNVQEILAAIKDPGLYDEIVFCGYGEPTLRLKILLAVARQIRSQGGRVRVNSDGLANRVYRKNVLPLLGECVDSLSVSLNAQESVIYDQHCHPRFDDAYPALLDFLRLAPSYISDVTATAIDGLPGVDIPKCQALADQLGVNFRRRVLDQVG